MDKSFFRDLIKEIDDKNTYIADDELHSAEFSGTVDTGCMILNGMLSGSIYGGVPDNKVIVFAGDPATGKTFFVLGIVKKFLDDNPTGGVFYYDTESAVTKKMMAERGIDVKRVIISEPATIEDFRTHVSNVLTKFMDQKTRPPMMMVLDSLGMLSTNKEVKDIEDGNDKRDMTRAQLIRGTFRALRLKLSKAKVPLLVTNHVASVIGAYVPTKVMGGGEGLKYAGDQIVFLSKKQDKDGTERIGNIIHCKNEKNRFTKEGMRVDVKLSYASGLNRYYGLLDLAEKHGIVKKISTKYEIPANSGITAKEKAIYKDPEKYFTADVLKQIDAAAAKEFKYGSGTTTDDDTDEQDDSDV